MIKRDQRGFTLIELLLVIAIVALIAGAATMATFQVINVTQSNNDRMTVIRQVQNAGFWISHDTLMAQGVVIVDDPETPDEEEFITLNWTDWDEDKKKHPKYHLVTYYFEDMAGGLKQLKRQYLIYDVDYKPIGDEETTLVAEYVDGSASFTEQDGVWKLTIKACLGTQTETGEYEITETREYEINPRVSI